MEIHSKKTYIGLQIIHLIVMFTNIGIFIVNDNWFNFGFAVIFVGLITLWYRMFHKQYFPKKIKQ